MSDESCHGTIDPSLTENVTQNNYNKDMITGAAIANSIVTFD
jgi:hypothetical protein